MTAAARSGLRWQVSSKLKASGSGTVSDCGSYGGSVGGFVRRHCCVRTLVALNNCLPPFAICFVCPRHTDKPCISVYMYVCVRVYTQQSHVPVFRQFFCRCLLRLLSVLGSYVFIPFTFVCLLRSFPRCVLRLNESYGFAAV